MANYDGADKRLARLFCPEYKTTEQLVGKWIDGSDLYQTSWSVQITNAESEDEVIADLSGLGFDYAEIVRASFVGSSGIVPIFANLKIKGRIWNTRPPTARERRISRSNTRRR